MRAMLEFQERYGSEAGCIEALARLRWPQGYVCARCAARRSYQLKTRARTFECARCGHQESVTAGTIFHRTRIADPADFVLQRAVARPTITYRELIDGLQPEGALPVLTG